MKSYVIYIYWVTFVWLFPDTAGPQDYEALEEVNQLSQRGNNSPPSGGVTDVPRHQMSTYNDVGVLQQSQRSLFLPEDGGQCTDTSDPEREEERTWRRRQVPEDAEGDGNNNEGK